MADETPNPSGEATPAAPAGQPGAPTITPEIEAVIQEREKKARDSAYAEARRTFESKKPTKKGTSTPEGETPSEPDPMKLYLAFDDATAELKLTAGQRQLLRDSVLANKPDDVAGFVKGFATKAGWSTEGTTTMAVKTTPAGDPAPSGRPASDAGTPAGTPNERPSDVLKWTKEDVERFYRSKGKAPDIYDARNAEVHKEIRQLARNALHNVRINLGPRR
jgi:hypothetical protein